MASFASPDIRTKVIQTNIEDRSLWTAKFAARNNLIGDTNP
jgi:hypothetical protein